MSWRSGARTSAAGLLVLASASLSLRAQAPGGAVPSRDELLEAEVRKLEEAYKRPGADRQALRARIAQILTDSDDPRQVARGLRIRLELEPGNEEVRRELAASALELKRPEVAIRLLTKVIQARPDDLKARVGLGDAYQTLDRDQEALAVFEEVVRRDPRNVEALVGAASSFMSLDRPESALQRARAALDLDKGNQEAQKLVEEASKEIAEGRIDSSEERELTPIQLVAELRTRLVAKPGDRALRKQLAEALVIAGWAGEARLEYLALLRDGPVDVGILVGLSRAHREIGDPTGARVYVEKARLAAPGSAAVELEVARVLDELGNVGLARHSFQRCLDLEPDFSAGLLEWGLFETEQKDLPRAAELLDRAHRLDPDDATILAAFAQVRLRRGQRAEGEALLKRARALDPREPLGWKLLAEIQGGAGNHRDAAAAWREYLFFAPFDQTGWLRLGEALADVGDPVAAAKALDLALSIDDEDPAILDGVDAAIRRLPWRGDLEALRLLVMEKRAHGLRSEGDLDGAVRMMEGLAEERARQMRRMDAALHDPEATQDPGERRAALNGLLSLTRAKVRVHEALSELYLDMDREDEVERQYHELRHLDPGSAEVVRKLAQLYFDRGDSRRTVAWYKALPPDTRLEPTERLQFAESLDAMGREEQAEDQYKRLARTEAPMDEVEEALGEHAGRKGNDWAAHRHYRRSVSLYGAAQASLDNLRARALSESSDVWAEFFSFDDSDGIDVSQLEVGTRRRIDRRTDAAVSVARFKVEDRFSPEVSDTAFQLLVNRELSERFRLSTILGTVRFNSEAGVAWDMRLDWNPDDEVSVWLRFFQDSINETPLASTRGFEQTGFELDGTWYAHHRYRLQLHMEETNITGGNHRSVRNLDLGARPFGPAVPGWLHLARGVLDYDRRVAPALYFAPQDQDRSEIYYQLPFQAGKRVFLDMIYGILDDFGFGLSHRAEVAATFDRGRRSNVGVDYKSIRRDRSYHDFARDYRNDELTVRWNAQF